MTVVERPQNWGLALNIIDGVTTHVNRTGRVIVLEDDLITAPYFLTFMNDALEAYKDEPRVGHIQACDFTQDPSLPDTFLIRWTGSWGWGTRARAWKHFIPDGRALLVELLARKLDRTFDFVGTYGYTRMLRRELRRRRAVCFKPVHETAGSRPHLPRRRECLGPPRVCPLLRPHELLLGKGRAPHQTHAKGRFRCLEVRGFR